MVAWVVDTLGSGLFLAGSIVFFTRFVGIGAVQVGAGLSLAGLTGLLASVPIGVLADRVGARPVMVALHLSRALGFGLYALCHTYTQFLLVACLIGVADRSVGALNQTLVSMAVAAHDRVRTMGLLRATGNVSFSVAGVLTGLALAWGPAGIYPMLVLVNAVSFAAVAVILQRLRLFNAASERPRSAWRLPSLRDRRYVGLAVVNCLMCAYHSLFTIGIPLFVLDRTHAPASLVAFLFVVNAVIVVAAQVRLASAVDRPGGAAWAFRRTGYALAACCLLVATATRFTSIGGAIAVLTAAVIALTIAEMLQQAAAWTVSFALAPADRQAEYLAVFNLGGAIERIAGPAVVALFLFGGGWPLWAAATVFLIAGRTAARLATVRK